MADPLSSIAGLSSGIDSKALVEQMMLLERRPAARLEGVIEANNKRTAALGQFQTTLDALKTAMAALADGKAFDAYSVTTAGVAGNGRALLAASAGAGAAPGAYQVKVLGLATAHKVTAGSGQASATEALGVTGAFALRRPGADPADPALVAVTLDGSESLSTIRDRINAATGTSKIQASIVSTKSDGSDQRLVLSSTQTGEAGRFELVATDGDPLAALGLAAPITQTGNDARAEIDGVVVTRATNTLSDVVAGVTMTLSAADENATATVTVDRLKSAPRDAVKGLVDAYNAAQTFLKAQTAVGGALAAEPMARTARGQLSAAVIAAGAGLPTDMATLASLGVSLTKEGTLSFDADRFEKGYTGRYDELKATIANRSKALTDVIDSLTQPITGAIDRRELSLADQNLRFTSRIADIDARLEKKRAALLAQFAKFEATLGGINAMGNNISAQLKGLTASRDD